MLGRRKRPAATGIVAGDTRLPYIVPASLAGLRLPNRIQRVAIAIAAAITVAGCAPPAPVGPQPLSQDLVVVAGTQRQSAMDLQGAADVTAVRIIDDATLSVEATGASNSATGQPAVAITVSAPSSAAPGGPYQVALEADACAIDQFGGACPSSSQRQFLINVSVTIVGEPAANADGSISGLSDPSPDRVASAEVVDGAAEDWRELEDELLVSIGTPDNPGSLVEARQIASQARSHVIGGLSKVGLYQFRLDSGQTKSNAAAFLNGISGVKAQPSTIGGFALEVVPSDIAADGADRTWQWDVVDAYSAWGTATGSTVKIGIVDNGVYGKHEDLNVLHNSSAAIQQYSSGGIRQEEGHGTHVSGLACARQNGRGVVGAAWGCGIVSAQALGPGKQASDANLLEAMWDVLDNGAKIVNVSLGVNLVRQGRCPDQADADRISQIYAERYLDLLRGVVDSERGRQALWTVGAGNNCVKGIQGIGQLADEFPHVLSVAAVNSDRKLATFSNKTAEIAAPGGVLTATGGGLVSTSTRCGIWGCRADYRSMSGTSMASPIVAGVAAMVMERQPTYSAADVAECLTQTGIATDGVGDLPSGYSNLPTHLDSVAIPIVNAGAAVRCGVSDAPTTAMVAVGGGHSCALLIVGTARCWGSNAYGQLGGESASAVQTMPLTVAGLTGATYIEAGGRHTCAVVAGGSVKCWGDNYFGSLGDGTNQPRSAPTDVIGLSGATQLALGNSHTCALLGNGEVKCWGYNQDGAVGDGTGIAYRPTPTSVVGVSNAVQITAGSSHTCALIAGGTVKCWGRSFNGSLGDGTSSVRLAPVSVSNLSGARQIAAGASHTCAAIVDGRVRCWGNNVSGQLGDGTTELRTIPVEVVGISSAFAVATGGDLDRAHSCATLSNGDAHCWGDNTWGQLGDGSVTASLAPRRVDTLSNIRAISADFRHLCATFISGSPRCWGSNAVGELGTGTTVGGGVPELVAGL